MIKEAQPPAHDHLETSSANWEQIQDFHSKGVLSDKELGIARSAVGELFPKKNVITRVISALGKKPRKDEYPESNHANGSMPSEPTIHTIKEVHIDTEINDPATVNNIAIDDLPEERESSTVLLIPEKSTLPQESTVQIEDIEEKPTIVEQQKEITLTPKEQELFDLINQAGAVTVQVMAKRLGITEGATKQRIVQLRNKLHEMEDGLQLVNLSLRRREAKYVIVTPDEAAKIESQKESESDARKEARENREQDGSSLLTRGGIILSDEIPDRLPQTASDFSSEPRIFAPVKDVPERRNTVLKVPTVSVEGPFGRFHIKQKDRALYNAIQAGMSEQQIADGHFDGNISRLNENLGSLTDSCALAGLVIKRSEDNTFTLSRRVPEKKEQVDSRPERDEQFLTLDSEDIAALTQNSLHEDHLLPIDLALFKSFVEHANSGREIDLEVFRRIVDPHSRLPGIDCDNIVRNRLRKIDNVVHFNSITSPATASKRLEQAIKAESRLFPKRQFQLLRRESRSNRSFTMALKRNDGQMTRPLLIRPLGRDSLTSLQKNEIGTLKQNESRGTISATVQVRALEILLQNDPVPFTFLKAKLGSEVQTNGDLGTILRTVDPLLQKWGLAISIQNADGLESVGLIAYNPDTHKPPHVSNEVVDVEAEEAALPQRQRRRQPSHQKIRL